MKHVKGISIPKSAICTLNPTAICPCPNNEKVGGDLVTLLILPLLASLFGKQSIVVPTDDC